MKYLGTFLFQMTKSITLLIFYQIQCSGEAPFTEDLPTFPREVYASFVLSTVAKGDIVNMDASRALVRKFVATEIVKIFCDDNYTYTWVHKFNSSNFAIIFVLFLQWHFYTLRFSSYYYNNSKRSHL